LISDDGSRLPFSKKGFPGTGELFRQFDGLLIKTIAAENLIFYWRPGHRR
jgi:hypothetical protein